MRRAIKITHWMKPDHKYGSLVVEKFINQLMMDGKKNTARTVFYRALQIIKTQTKKDPVAVLDEAIKNVSPSLEVRARRVGGATYQVPREVRPERKLALAMRWLIAAAKSKKGKPMAEKLAEELILATKNEGVAIKKREDTHRMAEANRAFAHFAW
ncbi:MAG: 30S ribosomal protein S7 [Candidatus Niyogibacteria bacterium]|nr:30S ribosomal protein S7 [Candidatus Niyogibacteria bacterium]